MNNKLKIIRETCQAYMCAIFIIENKKIFQRKRKEKDGDSISWRFTCLSATNPRLPVVPRTTVQDPHGGEKGEEIDI